ncbi:thioredoxin [Duganella sp. BJB1802]|uniref:thioredoxin n=1 Tax=Duganella sp. BJB1802 TaxID=2744575 RepID=UPI001592C7E9|nr:thioredoxin [Duganella sp. BJB1802]NVD71000.1 thioredoxin [Duganella sp. BJB1802]
MTSSILNATDASFETEVLKAPGLVLVDFWADWCGPCKALAPILADLADEYPEVRIVKVNADENRQVMEQHAVRGLPTLLLFSEGKECGRLLGTQSKTRLAALIDEKLEA